jgi:hypothetical protein
MGVVIIFALVALLAAYGAFTALKNKNFLGAFWAVATLAVFGWFAIIKKLKDCQTAVFLFFDELRYFICF